MAKNPLNDEHYDGNDEQIADLKAALEEAIGLTEKLRGEIKYMHDTGNVGDSISYSQGDLNDADEFLARFDRGALQHEEDA